MPELPQTLLLVLLFALLGLAIYLGRALADSRARVRRLDRRLSGEPTAPRRLDPTEEQVAIRRWVSRDFLRFMRQIHGPLKVREIPRELKKFIGSTFDPETGVILLRRKPALSEPGRENQLVVVSSPGTRIARGSIIEFGEGDLGYVAQTGRAMDRRELDQTPSATGDTSAMSGFLPELAAPLAVGSKTLGVVGIGKPRRFQTRAKELLDLIAQTTALALENSLVLHQIQTAASADPLTGVYNKGALLHRLDELIGE
ncbi:MAG: GAF domain-containing protein, partial [Thermoanaerobaculia bacterium]